MADLCKCCGEKIGFMDVEWDYIVVDDEDFKICGNCRKKIANYKEGNNLIEDIISEKTDTKIIQYIKNLTVEGNSQEIIEERKRIESKNIARLNDPLYDDIHQIAGDLRFIKNLIIVGLILSFVLGIVAGCSLL